MPKDNEFSLASILRLRSEGHANIRHHAAEIVSLSSAIGDMDAALLSATERNVDEQQALITAAQRLAALVDGCEGQR